MTVYVYGPRDRAPKGMTVVNTTSRSKEDWSRELSPFFLGPVDLYDGMVSKTMENAWQFSKVYYEHADMDNDEPLDEYFEWAKKGWSCPRAIRYPMGKGAKPLYSYWRGKHLSYVAARQIIYVPLYSKLVAKTKAFGRLEEMHQSGDDFGLWDFDGYNHRKEGMTLAQVCARPDRKMGHAFVLAMMLEGAI